MRKNLKIISNLGKKAIYIGKILIYIILLIITGCVYSFKGGSVPSHLKSIAIPIFEDQSGFGDPTLKDYLTQQLVEAFRNDNTLELADRNTADAVLEGKITSVREEASIIEASGNVREKEIKISISVQVTFNDMKLRKKVWEKNFVKWGVYPAGGGLNQREEGIKEAVRKLTDDIINATVAEW